MSPEELKALQSRRQELVETFVGKWSPSDRRVECWRELMEVCKVTYDVMQAGGKVHVG